MFPVALIPPRGCAASATHAGAGTALSALQLLLRYSGTQQVLTRWAALEVASVAAAARRAAAPGGRHNVNNRGLEASRCRGGGGSESGSLVSR